CSFEWVVHRNVCFYLSGPQEEGGWDWSQERCSARGASLVMITRDWEMEFLMRLKGNVDYWLGLRRQGERLVWVDGSTFEETFKVQGLGECVYLNEDDVASSSCSQSRPYICSKPQALV
ncbi:CLC2B protein, partial [Chauna torquata]|nr:CLC2B protein [Chauna torquata]